MKLRTKIILLSTVALAFGGAGVAGADSLLSHDQLPLPYDGDADQVITVVADSDTATSAEITAWERTDHGWEAAVGPVEGFVGEDGVGQASEQVAKTPEGVWTLTESFGNLPADDDFALPYLQVDENDWWVSDVDSELYNTYQRCEPGTCAFNEDKSEQLAKVGTAYDRAVVMDYNRNPPVPGDGSAFFLHVSTGNPTAGCVSMPAADLDEVLSWLDPEAAPVINIGIA